jgi:hypothetical protein
MKIEKRQESIHVPPAEIPNVSDSYFAPIARLYAHSIRVEVKLNGFFYKYNQQEDKLVRLCEVHT